MKRNSICLGLCLALVATGSSLRADDDNPAQAAARAALVKMLMDLSNSNSPSVTSNAPAPSAPTWDVAAPSSEATPTSTNAAQANMPAPQTVPAAPATVVAPPAAAPAAVTVTAPVAPAAPVTPAAPAAPAAPIIPIKVQPAVVVAIPKPAPAVVVVKPASPPAPVQSGREIVTIYGTVYKNAEVEKVDSDGIIISYSTTGGGLGMSKVYFEDLPYEVRHLYQR